mmetsp:Transcript_2964/g.5566  ORF Transcript_2964/g.5566 Transcript_2964/m.5566 type:complete len:211 (-) Transcript_2964:360-992(-)
MNWTCMLSPIFITWHVRVTKPSSVNLMALDSKLSRICCSRLLSPWMVSSQGIRYPSCNFAALGIAPAVARADSMQLLKSNSVFTNWNLSCCSFAKSKMSFTIRRFPLAQEAMLSTCSFSSFPMVLLTRNDSFSSLANPRMPCSGVRNSWLILATKRLAFRFRSIKALTILARAPVFSSRFSEMDSCAIVSMQHSDPKQCVVLEGIMGYPM